jgi:membrane-associated protein
MDPLHFFVDFVLHLDKNLMLLTQQYGTSVYAILFAIVFCETGLVVTPFLPGDSLLFAAGAITARPDSGLSFAVLVLLLVVAAILGDTVNYQVGRAIGPRVLASESSRLFNKKHLVRTHEFFEKHGGKAIVFARFVPIVRTFAPFVAGAGAMTYSKFLAFNVGGAVVWVVSLSALGYFFGNLEVVRKNFTLVVFAIIFISVLPGLLEFVKARRAAARTDAV